MSKRSDLGDNIRRIRKANHETQRELGDAIHVSDTAIANYESGYRQPDIQTLMAIARHYGVSIEELL